MRCRWKRRQTDQWQSQQSSQQSAPPGHVLSYCSDTALEQQQDTCETDSRTCLCEVTEPSRSSPMDLQSSSSMTTEVPAASVTYGVIEIKVAKFLNMVRTSNSTSSTILSDTCDTHLAFTLTSPSTICSTPYTFGSRRSPIVRLPPRKKAVGVGNLLETARQSLHRCCASRRSAAVENGAP